MGTLTNHERELHARGAALIEAHRADPTIAARLAAAAAKARGETPPEGDL